MLGLLGYSWQSDRRLIFNLIVREDISFLLEKVSTRRSLFALGAGINPGHLCLIILNLNVIRLSKRGISVFRDMLVSLTFNWLK